MKRYTHEQVLQAFNAAADALITALEPLPGEGKRDLVNAVVNVGSHYLDHPGESLESALDAADYDASPAEVLDWCRA